MDFNGNKPIYLQICDSICERVLSGFLKDEDRVSSVLVECLISGC